MTYRLYRRDSIIKGQWYYSVACQGCGEDIEILDDKSKGKIQNLFSVEVILAFHVTSAVMMLFINLKI